MGLRFARRDFLRFISAGSLSALGGWGELTATRRGEAMNRNLLDAIEASDVARASDQLAKNIKEGIDPWEIHLSLFPVVQCVLNPPFINPHLPKMYRVCRELVPYLSQSRIAALVFLEVREYARRPKLEKIRRGKSLTSPVTFKDVETAIKENDPGKVSVLMATFLKQKGGVEFARRLLLLGSGYLNNSLGHSVSCTAFILLEMLERTDQDSWPALSALASYFCKGRFHTTPVPEVHGPPPTKERLALNLLRATSGGGIVNLHHTITRYAIERSRKFLTPEDYSHMANAWILFLGDKKEERVTLKGSMAGVVEDYDRFYEMFLDLKAGPVAASLQGMINSGEGRHKLGRFVIKSLCDKYQGNYDPHYVTGLGSTLWLLDHYWKDTPIATNALYQYVDFLFNGLS
ncbi:MAG: hypothetical protein A2156_05055 [Deltaproteobacteria bacterium RBG_16_48_10]|nr:MAG: hypothetical protein A2156_05055 [Deltaproteobacteria bacterium RBG_16_48_10]